MSDENLQDWRLEQLEARMTIVENEVRTLPDLIESKLDSHSLKIQQSGRMRWNRIVQVTTLVFAALSVLAGIAQMLHK